MHFLWVDAESRKKKMIKQPHPKFPFVSGSQFSIFRPPLCAILSSQQYYRISIIAILIWFDIDMIPGKTEWRIWAEFRLFSAHFLPKIVKWYLILAIYTSAVLVQNFGGKTQTWYPICHFSAQMQPVSQGAGLSGYPNVYRFCLLSAFCSAHFLPIFHLTFCSFYAGPVLQGISIKRLKQDLKRLKHWG